MAMVTGSSPRPNPCRARPATTTTNWSDTAASTQPTSTTPRATRITSRCRGPSARRPITGVASAPVSRAAVSSHWAVLSVTWSAWAMVGISGAPRLLTMAHQRATRTRVGTSAPGRRAWPIPVGRTVPAPGGPAAAPRCRRTHRCPRRPVGPLHRSMSSADVIIG